MRCAGIVLAVFAGCAGGIIVWIRLLLSDYRDRCKGGGQ